MMAFSGVFVMLIRLVMIPVLVTDCIVLEANYQYMNEWNDKVCRSEDLVFSEKSRTVIDCLNHCTKSTLCTSIFYKKTESACTGCMFHSNNASLLNDTPGSVFYTKRLYSASTIPCGQPHSGRYVRYRQYFLREPTGYQVTYKCTPCTFFKPDGATDKIFCQDNGTWTTPICVSAADVGYLRNGNPVPAGNIGCADVLGGDTCSNEDTFSVMGIRYNQKTSVITGCYCDELCCYYKNCCYDYFCSKK